MRVTTATRDLLPFSPLFVSIFPFPLFLQLSVHPTLFLGFLPRLDAKESFSGKWMGGGGGGNDDNLEELTVLSV